MLRAKFHLCIALLIAIVAPIPVAAEALPSVTMLNLIYRMSKANAGDDVQQQLGDVDARLQAARAAGQAGEVRRQLARGLALATTGAWSEAQEYNASLVLRVDQTYADPTSPVMLRLSQIFPATLPGAIRATARATLHEPSRRSRMGEEVGNKLRDLGELADIGLDLVETPTIMQVDLAEIVEGDYQVRFELFDGDKSLGSAGTPLSIRPDVNARTSRLRQSAGRASATLRPEILYPLDYMRKIDTGLVQARGFDVDAELIAAEAVAKAAAQGSDPFAGRTGDFERHYLLEAADEIMPYRIYVPENYPKEGQYPLIVALHGLGGNEDSMFGAFYGMTPLAESHGYIVVAPMGYRRDGGYGGFGQQSISRRAQLSEADVLEVLARTRAEYAIDPERIYLMGHSMGAIGTWRIASRHPEIWAGLGPIAGFGDPRTAQTIRHIPQIVIHGDADLTVPVTGSRAMVEALRKLEAEVTYIEVPGGGHSDIAPTNMPAMFEFFDSHRRSAMR
jgi:predicted esterase